MNDMDLLVLGSRAGNGPCPGLLIELVPFELIAETGQPGVPVSRIFFEDGQIIDRRLGQANTGNGLLLSLSYLDLR